MPQSTKADDERRRLQRKPTLPFLRSTRQKPRRWPLVLRFYKGAIHGNIIAPVVLHTIFAALISFLDQNMERNLGLPASIIPSLSIVVGLMLVFRNQTSYNRFWEGRNLLTTMITSVRNLSRSFLACSSLPASLPAHPVAPPAETERVVRILLAILYATKNHLRAGWGADVLPGQGHIPGYEVATPEYSDLLPQDFKGLQIQAGVGLPLQLTYVVEVYIKRYSDAGAFRSPPFMGQLNDLVAAYGKMETIRLTHIPVAILIHQRQVLALFNCVLPFALVDEMGWWAVPIVALVSFTLYGIDGIAAQLEDPFGLDRNDIKMDNLVEDVREEIAGMVSEWRRVVGWAPTDAGASGLSRDSQQGGVESRPSSRGHISTLHQRRFSRAFSYGSLDADRPERRARIREMFIEPPSPVNGRLGMNEEEAGVVRSPLRPTIVE